MFAHMDRLRMQHVLKKLYNQIDVLRRWRYLNENSEAWYLRKSKRRIFNAWLKQIRLQKTYFVVFDRHQDAERARWLSKILGAVNKQRA